MNMRIGIVGAGNMGAGIAQKYAMSGFDVVVVDQSEASLTRGRENITKMLDEAVARKVITRNAGDRTQTRLRFSTSLRELHSAPLVIEAIFENLDAKRALFAELDSLCPPTTLLATNTSSFAVADLCPNLKYPERVLGLHYFYHPAKNKLVEVIKGPSTSDAAWHEAWRIQDAIGKLAIASKDAPGFVVNRFFVPWLNEAMRLLDEGVANIATIDACAKEALGIGMGPFELMNVTGVPITMHAATSLAQQLGEFYAPCSLIHNIVDRKAQWDLTGDIDIGSFGRISNRLQSVVFYLAAQLVFHEEVCSLDDCDLGARVGLRWKKGPFELMSNVGVERAIYMIEQLKERYPSIQVPSRLTDHANARAPLAAAYVTSERIDGVGVLTFNRPDTLNAFHEAVLTQLGERFAELADNDEVRGIVIRGRGKAFVAGADISFFVEQISKGDIARIVRFAAFGQQIFDSIDTCSKPVVCCIDGLALGGGLELALACDVILATPSSKVGFPETGIGIFPGLGGTQRTPRRVGEDAARYLVLVGDVIAADRACAMGLVDEMLPKENIFARALEVAQTGLPLTTTTQPLRDDAIINTFSAPLQQLLALSMENMSPEQAKSLQKLRNKAPLALLAADELIRMSSTINLDDGLKAEIERLPQIFATQDAWIGLTSIGKSPPKFTGT